MCVFAPTAGGLAVGYSVRAVVKPALRVPLLCPVRVCGSFHGKGWVKGSRRERWWSVFCCRGRTGLFSGDKKIGLKPPNVSMRRQR